MKATLSLSVMGVFLLMGALPGPARGQESSPSVEDRLLEVLKERKVITDADFDELKGLATKMREEQTSDKQRLEGEIDRYIEEAQVRKAGETGTGLQMGYKDGLFFKTPDGKYSMTVGGYVQVRYSYINLDPNDNPFKDAFDVGSDGSSDRNAGVDVLGTFNRPAIDDSNNIDIRRGRFFVKGNVIDPTIGYFMQIETGDQVVTLRDYWIDYTRFDPLNIKIGQFKVPFGRQELTSASSLLFMDRTRMTEFFAPGREGGAGLMVYGLFGGEHDDLFEYYGGAFNGEGINTASNDGPGLLYAGRLSINPFGTYGYDESDVDRSESFRATLGGNIVWHPDDNSFDPGAIGGNIVDVDTTTYGVDAGVKISGLSVQGEYFYQTVDPTDDPSLVGDKDRWHPTGFYGQAGFILPGTDFELAGRYGLLYDQGLLGQGNDNDTTNDIKSDFSEYTFGVNYYFAKHRAKIQADWTRYTRDPNADGFDKSDDDIYRIQVQLMF